MNPSAIDYGSEFGMTIRKVFDKIRPKNIIETGTFFGLGSTSIIASAILDLGLVDSIFYSIEVNPIHFRLALKNLHDKGLSNIVEVINGLTIFRNQLPNKKKLAKDFVDKKWPENVYIDHSISERVQMYYSETNFPSVPDGILLDCLSKFEYKPDFILLDSGGHIGELEFDLVVSSVKKSCTIALDDIYHVKHFCNMQKIERDKRFDILYLSKEKFGFCIVNFIPCSSGVSI
jgi:hypothetical protein